MTDKKPNKVIIKKDTTTNKKMVATFFNKEGKKIKTSDGFMYLFNTLKYRFFN